MTTTMDQMITRPLALELGYDDEDIAHLIADDEWQRIRRGTYLTAKAPKSREQRHRLAVLAIAPDISDRSAFGHLSGAILHGIPLWKVPLPQVHVTRHGLLRSRQTRTLYTHAGGPNFEAVFIDGLPVVPAARTVVDLARTLPFEEAVVAADGALHRNIVTSEELMEQLVAARNRHGAERAVRVVAFADGRSESVGESRSRVRMRRCGLPVPELQVEIQRGDGTHIARCDFGYEDFRVAGEFDGFVKYGRLLKPGEEPGDAVFREKRREDAVRDEAWGMVRWVWDELDDPGVIEARWRRAFKRARAR